MSHDRALLFTAGTARAISVGLVGPLLGVHLANVGIQAGILLQLVGVGLAGAALGALLVAYGGDRFGRRRSAIIAAVLTAAGVAATAFIHEPGLLFAVACIGMLNGMGKDRGASPVLEQTMLSVSCTDADRTTTIATGTALMDIGAGVGSLLLGLPTLLIHSGITDVRATTATMLIAAAIATIAVPCYLRLSPAVEGARGTAPQPLTAQGKTTITKLSLLFSLDAIGGGFLTAAGMAYIFKSHFAAPELVIALLFTGARLLNAGSHLVAARLAKRIGLVKTMVFTHIPSSILLMTVAWAPNVWVAAILFLLREGLVEMDVPTRTSYVLAVVQPHERTAAGGITGIVRMVGWAAGAFLAGPLTAGASITAPLVAGAGLKIIYDLALWSAFSSVKPPEER